MKKTYQYIALAVLTLGLAACTQEEDFTPQGNQKDAPLAIASIGVTDLTTRATITTENGTDYLTGGSMGVFVTSTTGGRYEGSNIKWTYNNGWALDDATIVLFENNVEKQKIAAYYPHNENLSTENTYSIEQPEVYGADYENYDYLYGEYVSLDKNPATIKMKHLLSKVTVSISHKGNDLGANDAVKSIALFNVPRTASWTVPTSTLSVIGTADQTTTLYANDSDNDQTVDNYVGYALPDGSALLGIRVTMSSGRMFAAQASITDGLASSNHYLIGLRVGKDAVTVGSISMAPWTEGAAIPNSQADEAFLSIDGTIYTSTSELQNAVKSKLSQDGATSVTINGYLSEELHEAVISAINEVKTEGAVTNGYLLAGSVTYTTYTTFTDAVAAWTDGTTLTMLGNADNSKSVNTTAKSLVLDLNGYKLASSASNAISMGTSSASELTIRDNKGGGCIQGNISGGSPDGMLSLESGTVEGTVNLFCNFTMTDGTIRCENRQAIYAYPGLNIFISGGEINSSTYAIYNNGATILITGSAKLIGKQGFIFTNVYSNVTITGGIFSHDPVIYVDTKQYTVTNNGDGTWSVTAKE